MDDLKLTKSERETLKAVYRLTKGDEPAHTGDLAERLDVSPSTVTTTVKRLADRGLVEHRLYKGVELTDAGRREAVGRHPPPPHRRAVPVGHARLRVERGRPARHVVRARAAAGGRGPDLHRARPAGTCPHGFPIPAPETDDLPDMPPLYDLEPGDVAVVAVPGSTDPEVVAFLDTLGLRPGGRVEVKEKHPFDGPLVLRVDGKDRTLGRTVAQQVFVQRIA